MFLRLTTQFRAMAQASATIKSTLSLPQPRHSKPLIGQAYIDHSSAIVRNWLPTMDLAMTPFTRPKEHWRNWAELKVKLLRLPPSLNTTGQIYKALSRYGAMSRIEVVQRNGYRYEAAFVVFSPPPNQCFWDRPIQLPDGTRLSVELLEYRPYYVTSPVNPSRRFEEEMSLLATSIDFGFMYTELSMMRMKKIDSFPSQDVTFTMNLRRGEIDIKFPVTHPTKLRNGRVQVDRYRFQIPFKNLGRVYEIDHGPDRRAFVIPLESPPRFYRKTDNVEATHSPKVPIWHDWRTWERQTDIVEKPESIQKAPLRFRKDDAVIDLGRWICYYLIFDRFKNDQARYNQIKTALEDYNVVIIRKPEADFSLREKEKTKVWTYLDLPEGDGANLSALQQMEYGMKHLSFAVRYQLEVCLSRGCLNEYNMTEDFLRKLTDMDEFEALDIMEKAVDMKRRFYNPMDIFRIHTTRNSACRKIPPYCALSRAGTVTPTTIHYSGPAVETSNRVIRQYPEYQDRFLRVRFADELTYGRINSQSDNSHEEVFDRIIRAMQNGITLGERHYEFLAFGNSQFREHGAYFFSSLPGLTAAQIRSQLGYFTEIRVPAKWCARLGQNFSTTRAIATKVVIRDDKIDDIERNGFNFTDGVGQISTFLARMIAAEFSLPNPSEDPPSLFQFRLGGCKGVLVVAPEVQSQDIHIRPSQYKFPAKHLGLEVIRSSQYVTATLNRQIVILLSALGVPDEVFGNMLKDMLSDLERAMEDKRVALHLLQRNIDFNQSTLVLASMILDGFMEAKDPFMISMLKLWRAWTIKYLKEKAKIFVGDGACLLGCVDEYAVLKGHYDAAQPKPNCDMQERIKALPEIFLQIDAERRGSYRVLQGICILARNPSLHPGDVRVVMAVDKPQLRHLKNVVVLPQTGDRDLGSMCSGGDLDGDDYLVIWDQNLIPKEWNLPPMDFTPLKPVILNRDVMVDDITAFFVQYMKNDLLPTIALAHLCWADYEDEGIKDEKCK